MARYELDEVESDEVYHALLERKTLLDKRAKDLEEKDGLPEAAQSVRGRIELYNPNGEGKSTRPGLIRLFAPQRDIESEAQAARAAREGERDADGGQDMFGGGAETGGGHPPGETIPAPPKEKKKRGGRKGKTTDGADAVDGTEPVEEAEFEVIPEERRLGAGDADVEVIDGPVERALATLDQLAKDLLSADAAISDDMYSIYAGSVMELLPVANSRLDVDMLRNQIDQEFRGSDENAHALGYFLQRTVDNIRDDREKPIGRDAHTAGNAPTTGAADAPEPADSDARSLSFGSAPHDHSETTTSDVGRSGDAAPAGAPTS